MAKQNLIAALDIGGGKITAVAATVDQQKDIVQILAGTECACGGLTGGIVSDIRETARTVKKIITYLEENTEGEINALYLALRGEHIETRTNKGAVAFTKLDKSITQEDIEQTIARAKDIPIKQNYEILSVVPQGFYINNDKVKNPEGMEGDTLEIDVHITTGASSTFNNLNKAFELAQYSVTDRFYGLVCLAEGVLSPETKEIGTLLIDLGKDNTSAGVYVDGALRCSYDIKLGSDLITSDIAKMLTIPHKEAEDIKLKYGTTFPDNYDNEEEIVISSLYSKEPTKINRDYLLDLIRPRVQDIFEAVKEKIQNSDFYQFANIAVLTGGGSLLPGIKEQARETLGIKNVVCASVLRDLVDCKDEFLNPKYSTAVSLAYFAAKKDILTNYRETIPSKNWVKKGIEFFKKSDFFGG